MSPAPKRSRATTPSPPKPREVKGEGTERKVTIALEGSDIKVTWLCGASRKFSAEDLKDQLSLVEDLGLHIDMWLHMQDSVSNRYGVRVQEGHLTANDGDTQDNGKVEWAALQRALKATLEDADKATA